MTTAAAPGTTIRPGRVDRRDLALFDLDRTLLAGSSLACLGRELVRRGDLKRRHMVVPLTSNVVFARRGAGDATSSRMRDMALRTVADMSYERLADALPATIDAIASRIYGDARSVIGRHLGAGDHCVILSAAPQELVAQVAQLLGMHRGIGTRAEVVAGTFTGRVEGAFCYGEGKLTPCGHPAAVNPDKALAREARQQAWRILHFA